ncbi:DUF4293 domain-containing protein [uncultured Bacteroides sp.]|uniref:DUF4293 domain-containing protein n=1 Tax=uncultured Bacteroides sp. TaxID=162156 RepID=UPI002AA9492B|nr:DUF4293 domain-containing protein [uncultured Bacteroides sp.]
MIQRIQTVFLLLVTGLLVASMCLPVGYFVADAVSYTFKPMGLEVNGVFHSTWGIFCILLLSSIISFATIFLFKNRILQIRMTVFCCVLLVGYYLSFLAFMFMLKSDLGTSFRISWALCFPLIAIILNYLAIRAIGRDEVMVKAADRLR